MSYCSELLKCIFVVTVMFVEREVKKGENHLTGKMIHEGLNQDASKMIDEDMKHFNRYMAF